MRMLVLLLGISSLTACAAAGFDRAVRPATAHISPKSTIRLKPLDIKTTSQFCTTTVQGQQIQCTIPPGKFATASITATPNTQGPTFSCSTVKWTNGVSANPPAYINKIGVSLNPTITGASPYCGRTDTTTLQIANYADVDADPNSSAGTNTNGTFNLCQGNYCSTSSLGLILQTNINTATGMLCPRYSKYIDEASAKYHLPFNQLAALGAQETGGSHVDENDSQWAQTYIGNYSDPYDSSNKVYKHYTYGPMQVSPADHPDALKLYPTLTSNTEAAILASAFVFAQEITKYPGNFQTAVDSYNNGDNSGQKHITIPPNYYQNYQMHLANIPNYKADCSTVGL